MDCEMATIVDNKTTIAEAASTLNNHSKLEAHRGQMMEGVEDERKSLDAVVKRALPSVEHHRMKPAGQVASASVLRRLLKYALPLPFILILIFGSLYFLCDDWFTELDRYGLVIDPRFQHVHDAPPV
jgi:hypothetical protein